MPSRVRLKIGVSVACCELVVPSNADFSNFFRVLQEFGGELVELSELSEESLSGLDLLFLGVPKRKFSEDELAVLKDFVASGGQAVVFSSMGGDVAPDGDEEATSNLGDLVPRVKFPDRLLIEAGEGEFEITVASLYSHLYHSMSITLKRSGLLKTSEFEAIDLVPSRFHQSLESVRVKRGRIVHPEVEPKSEKAFWDFIVSAQVSFKAGKFICFSAARSFENAVLFPVRDHPLPQAF